MDKTNKELYIRNLGLILATVALCIGYLLSSKNFTNLNLDIREKEYIKEYKKYNTSIKIYSKSKNKVDKLYKEIDKIYDEYFNLSNRYNKDSELYKLNNNKYDEDIVKIDSKLYDMIEYGIKLYEESEYTININNGKLQSTWDKAISLKEVPSKDDIDDIEFDIKDIELLGNNKIKNNTKININLDSFKYDYINDIVMKYLEKNNIKSYIIYSGNNIYTGSYYQGMGNYVVDIKSPNKDDNSTFTIIKMSNKKLSSTSLYEDYFEDEDKVYNHILNDKTKYPSDNMIGVSVVCSLDSNCQFESRKLFNMSIEDGKKYVNSNDKLEAVWIYKNDKGKITSTSSNKFYD